MFVIVGGGLAGAKAAETLRAEGFDGDVVLFCEEQDRPYERPPLSKGYLLGKAERDSAFVHPAQWYEMERVDLRTGVEVTEIDPAAHTLRFQGSEESPGGYSGGIASYDKLLLTTGASPRRLDIPGGGLGGVLYLRRLEDSDRLREQFRGGARIVVVGAGWIGLETAAAARMAGCHVTVVEPQP